MRPSPQVALIGAGAMGLAMAQRLREAGLAVTVRDIDPAREALARAAGCHVAASPAEATARCSHLIVAVVDGAQTHDVLFGADGAAGAMSAGSVVLLCPTIAPEAVEAAHVRLAERGLLVIDAPMSGGPQRARLGLMSLMLAGSDAAVARAQVVLELLSSKCFRVGSRPGDGARTKLVNNLLAAVNLAGAAEAMALAARLGLDAPTTLAVIEASSGQSWIGSERGHRHLAGDPRVLARVALLAKDTGLALAAAGDAAPLPLARAAAAAFDQAVVAGLADADDAVLMAQALWALAPGPRESAP